MSSEENLNLNEDKDGSSEDLAQQLAEAQQKIGELSKTNEELGGAKESLERQLGDANKELTGEDYLDYLENKSKGKIGGQSNAGSEFNTSEDFDRASNTEVAKFVVKHVEGKLAELDSKIGKSSKQMNDKIGLAYARLDVEVTKAKYNGNDGGPSWAENEKEIVAIAKANPSWGAEQCYKQFKLEHKAKVDAEAEAKRKKTQEEEELITEKGGVAGSTAKKKQMSAEEAAEFAYRKAFGTKNNKE